MIKYKEVFSTDCRFSESFFIVIEKEGILYGFTPTCYETNDVYLTDIDLEFPDWINFEALNKFCDASYSPDIILSGDALYQMIADTISYYGVLEFNGGDCIYKAEELEKKFGKGVIFEELSNDQIVELFLNN